VDDLDELFRGSGPWMVACRGRVNDMVANMVFNHLGDEPVQRSSTGRDLLQNRCTICLRLDGTFNGLQLATDATDPGQKLLLFSLSV
jgi:hypothetical protein